MKITTKKVMQWDSELQDYVILEEESYEYDGPVAEAKGGGSSQTVTQKPFEPAIPALQDIITQAQGQFGGGGGVDVAGFTPAQRQAQELQTQAATGGIAQLAEAGLTSSLGFLGGDARGFLRAEELADLSTQPVYEQLQREVLPAISSRATQAGAFGGSRQALLEGQAIGDAAESAQRIRAGILSDENQRQRQAQLQTLSLLPQIQAQQLAPAQALSRVGEQQQQQQQNLNEQEFQNLQRYLSLISPVSGVGGSTVSPGARSGGLLGGLGGAASGAALGSMFFPGIGTAIGAVGGGLLGAFS